MDPENKGLTKFDIENKRVRRCDPENKALRTLVYPKEGAGLSASSSLCNDFGRDDQAFGHTNFGFDVPHVGLYPELKDAAIPKISQIDPENKGVTKRDPDNKGLSGRDIESKGFSSAPLRFLAILLFSAIKRTAHWRPLFFCSLFLLYRAAQAQVPSGA